MAKTRAAMQKDWTIMVYLAGDNNLDGAGVVDLAEMKAVGSGDRINVVAQFDRVGTKGETQRYYLRKGTTTAKDVVKKLGETNMGDPKVLEDFVTWAVASYPAQCYMLVLWNHGAGWDDANLYEGDVFSGATPPVARKKQPLPQRGRARGAALPMSQTRAGLSHTRRALFRSTVQKAVSSRGIAFDDQAQDFLDNVELKRVMTGIKKRLGRKLDILAMDACLMSMIEVAYQMRDVAEVTVGSEETEPGDGWPYDRILKALAAKPAMGAEDLGKTIVTQYLASYKAGDNVTQSAVSLKQTKALASAVHGLGKALQGALANGAGRSGLMTARAQVQEYSRPYDDYCDLLDLCALLSRHVGDAKVKSACDAVKQAAGAAILASGFKGTAVDNSNGISIYFPKRRVSPLYKTLDFTKASGWDEFIAAYVVSLGR